MPLHFEPKSREKSIERMKETFRRAGPPGTIRKQLEYEMSVSKKH